MGGLIVPYNGTNQNTKYLKLVLQGTIAIGDDFPDENKGLTQ
jgi:hypothetical protein